MLGQPPHGFIEVLGEVPNTGYREQPWDFNVANFDILLDRYALERTELVVSEGSSDSCSGVRLLDNSIGLNELL